ncbi:MAG: hypothetical protein KDC53_23900 [Saprospiraceae bacterium]|nr:hypothetical protein [Saprospiraceae bacterium]
MKLVINLLLFALIGGLAYLLVYSIQEPIKFKAEKDKRQNAVIDKLITIRKMQEFYRDIKGGEFAPSFDSLSYTLKTGDFRNIKVVGDPDDPNFSGKITYDTTYIPAIDTIEALGINLDSLAYVPYTDGIKFEIQADTLTYQSTLVNVVQVGVPIKSFMGQYGDPKYARYDNSYKPNNLIKFGDMTKPNLAGNWER